MVSISENITRSLILLGGCNGQGGRESCTCNFAPPTCLVRVQPCPVARPVRVSWGILTTPIPVSDSPAGTAALSGCWAQCRRALKLTNKSESFMTSKTFMKRGCHLALAVCKTQTVISNRWKLCCNFGRIDELFWYVVIGDCRKRPKIAKTVKAICRRKSILALSLWRWKTLVDSIGVKRLTGSQLSVAAVLYLELASFSSLSLMESHRKSWHWNVDCIFSSIFMNYVFDFFFCVKRIQSQK